MPLLTKILKPEEFTAQTLAELFCAALGPHFSQLTPTSRLAVIDWGQSVLDGLRARGIVE